MLRLKSALKLVDDNYGEVIGLIENLEKAAVNYESWKKDQLQEVTRDTTCDAEEMDKMSKDAAMQAIHRAGVQGSIAIAYTVWAKKKGGGKHMVNEVYKMIKGSNHLNRLVTLSPMTDMARKFHLKNGAKEVQVNLTTQNFEYDIELSEWEKFRDRAKGWLKIK